MIKPVSVKTQRILMYLPGANILCTPIWIYNSFYFNEHISTNLKSLFIVFSSSVPLMFLQVIVEYYWPMTGKVIGYVNAYLIPYLIGFRLAKYQEELEKAI